MHGQQAPRCHMQRSRNSKLGAWKVCRSAQVAAGRTGASCRVTTAHVRRWTRRICNVFKGSKNKGKRCLPSNVDVLIFETRASVDMRQENAASWSDLPTSALRAELLRRQANNNDERPACGTAGTTKDYNMPLHVFALVLILVLSTLGQSCQCISDFSPH